MHLLAIKDDLPFPVLVKSCNQAQQGGLAAPGRPQHTDKLLIGDVKTEVIKGGHLRSVLTGKGL